MMFKKISIRHILATAALLLTASAAKADTTWDFTTTPTTDQTNLAADTENWTDTTTNSYTRYYYNGTLSAAALYANNTELTMTKGLLFTAATTTKGGRIRIDVNTRLGLNGAGIILTIPDLTAGQTVTISYSSASSTPETARYMTATNLDVTNLTESSSTDAVTSTGTVSADGNVTLTTSAGLYIYSLSVTGATTSGDTSDDSASSAGTLSSDNSTSQSSTVNQAIITSTDKVRYYNTADLTSIVFDDPNNTVTVNGTTSSSALFSDVYDQLATNVAFSKGVSTLVTSDNLTISESNGWFESLYAEWQPVTDAASYTVKVKSSTATDYTAVDSELIRTYTSDNYIRVDAVGLAAGTYEMVVTALGESKDTLGTATVENLVVTNYSREGFAHFKCDSTSTYDPSEGVGAYKNDGTLKDGAKVFYVTSKTASTISTTVQTGSSTSQTFTGIQNIINAYQKGCDTTPITFRVLGLVQKADLDSIGSTDEGLQIKGKSGGYSEMNITIEGIGEDATIHGFGFLIKQCTSVEMRNLGIMWQMDDGISIDSKNSNIWIHNIDIFYGQPGSDSDQKKGDGSIDLKGNSQYITIDHCHFWDSGKSSLCGMKSETRPNYITYHHNWFDHSDSRHARIRTMSVHMWNNYYDGCAKYGIGATYACSVFSENNYFRHSKHPFLISKQGNGGSTFSGEDGGIIKDYGSVFAETGSSSNYTSDAYSSSNTTDFDYYAATSRDETVPSTVVTKQGGTCYDNFDTNSSLMYSYTADAASNVPTVVKGYYGAGRLNHGSFQYTFDDEDDTSSSVITALQTAIENYSGGSVTVSGSSSSGSDTGSSDTDTDDDTTDSGSDNNPDDTEDTSSTTTNVTVSADTYCTFDSSGNPSNSTFTVSGNGSSSYGTATVNNVTYTTCLKIESSTSITFTTSAEMTLTLVFSETKGNYNIKVDGTKVTSTTNVLTYTLAAGSHTLTKADSAYLFYIGLTSTSTSSTTDE